MLFAMCLERKVGKLYGATGLAATTVADINESCKFRLYVKDKNAGLWFLVDSGTDVLFHQIKQYMILNYMQQMERKFLHNY